MKVRNKALLEVPMCDQTVVLETQELEAEKLDICFEKEQNCNAVFVGGCIKYAVKICNQSDCEIKNLTFKDILDECMELCCQSFTVNGVHEHPEICGREILYKLPCLKPHVGTIIMFKVRVVK